MENLFSIEGRVIVITGGTGVLGSVIASYLAARAPE
jgi:NAD(P)-dependent dehydrogenase (short-subunit alcohol dehydrogenase family)